MSPRFRLLRSLSIALLVLFFQLICSAGQSTGAKSSAAQAVPSPSSTPQAAPATPDYAKEAMVLESSRVRATYQEDGSSTREVAVVARVLSQAGVQSLAVLKFAYTSADETLEFDYVRVRKPDGTVVATPDYNIQDMPAEITRDAPMYSDVHEKHVTVKALGVGDTLEYLLRYRTTKPQVPGQFWFEYTFPKDVIAKDEELVIDVPRDKYVKVASPDYPPQTKDDGARRIYTWKTANLERKETNPQLMSLQVQEAPKPSVQLTTFKSWEDVGRWYSDLQRSQLVVTPQIQAKAAELTKGLTSDEDKIRALYDFVSTKYHYVSLSFGIGRYQPHPAEDVLENEYGDCKDKHTLLAALLKAAGFDAWPALINATRKINPDVPSPGQFDHVITVVPQAGKLLWLDTTPGVAPFGLILGNLRDKQALVMPTGKPAELMTTPANPPFPSSQTFTATGKLSSEGTFTGHMKMSAFGDTGVVYRLVFQQFSSAQWKDLVQRISYGLGFAGEVSNVDVSNLADINKPFEYSYDYKREKIGDWDNHRIGAPLPPIGVEASAQDKQDKKKPEQSIFLGAPGEIVYRAQFDLPSVFTATLPKKVDLSDEFADYHASYESANGSITVNRELVIKKAEVPPADWEKYQTFASAVNDDYVAAIALQNPWDLSGGSPRNDQSVPADQAYERGTLALKRGDLAAADDAFHLALYIKPSYRGAHYELGLVQLRKGNKEAALEEFRKEIELNPDFDGAYWSLASTLMNLQRNPEAVAAWREYLKRNPGNNQAALFASQILMDDKKYSDAIEILQTAVEVAPDNRRLQLRLGLMCIRNGERDKGDQIVHDALAADSSYRMLNSAGYFLADEDLELAQAKTYLDEALEKVESATVEVNLSNDELLKIAPSIGQIWDSVGWLYFRTGEYAKALPYVRSAWLLGQHPTVGDHLGQLYAKLGDKEKAAHTYRLAAAAVKQSPLLDKIKKEYEDLTGKPMPTSFPQPYASGAHGRFAGAAPESPGGELSRMREVRITDTAHSQASGVFSIVFEYGKVDQVTQVDGDESLSSFIDAIKGAKFNLEFPNPAPVKVARRGIVSCGSLGCDVVLMPLDAASSD